MNMKILKKEIIRKDSRTPEIIKTPTCPICGCNMILRTAKKGPTPGNKFYGCSRYPKCKGIINSNDSYSEEENNDHYIDITGYGDSGY